eukprot:TRINITY_DN14800_c0_g1_i1.p1 TRINITY_DN14800_c0_g1~~TRINITY_DN14800_c0_g1_i1.p1  ORF type:complete len:657 (-),score=202.39 TRINITY_DN14800_c0_g1_i1:141-2111(-)
MQHGGRNAAPTGNASSTGHSYRPGGHMQPVVIRAVQEVPLQTSVQGPPQAAPRQQPPPQQQQQPAPQAAFDLHAQHRGTAAVSGVPGSTLHPGLPAQRPNSMGRSATRHGGSAAAPMVSVEVSQPRGGSPTRHKFAAAAQLPATRLELLPSPSADAVDSLCLSSKTLCTTVLNHTIAPQEQKSADQQLLHSLVKDLLDELQTLSSRVCKADSQLASVEEALQRLSEAAVKQREKDAETTDALARLDAGLAVADVQRAAQSADTAELRRFCEERWDAVEKAVAAEAEARLDYQKVTSKELREQMSADAERVNVGVMREMRERTDAQRVLREELQHQQQSLVQLMSRMDEMSVELRTELPRLAQEDALLKAELSKIAEDVSVGLAALDKQVVEETSAREAADKAVVAGLQADADNAAALAREELAKVRSQLEAAQQAEADATAARIKAAEQDISCRAAEAGDLKQRLDQLFGQLRRVEEEGETQSDRLRRKLAEAEADVRNTVDAKVLEVEAGLRGWVDSTLSSQVKALEDNMLHTASDIRGWTSSAINERSAALEVSLKEVDGTFHTRLRSSEASLRGWVESVAIARLNDLDRALRTPKLAERTTAVPTPMKPAQPVPAVLHPNIIAPNGVPANGVHMKQIQMSAVPPHQHTVMYRG